MLSTFKFDKLFILIITVYIHGTNPIYSESFFLYLFLSYSFDLLIFGFDMHWKDANEQSERKYKLNQFLEKLTLQSQNILFQFLFLLKMLFFLEL